MKITKKRIKEEMTTSFNGGKYDHYFKIILEGGKYFMITFKLQREVLEIISYKDPTYADADYGKIYDGKKGFIEAVQNYLKNI